MPGAPPTGASGATAARCGSHRGLLGETEDVERHAGGPHLPGEVGLDARAFADDGVDRLEVQQLFVAHEACALAQCPVEGEADGLDAARGGPGVGNLVDADLAKESAKLQALQVKQQLGVQALSIANQNPQSILSLFRG